MKIRCLVIDDEAIARRAIAAYVEKIDVLQLMGVFKNAVDAKSYLLENKVDLLFCDIEMPRLNGLDFLRQIDPEQYVIFTTAYPRFALESFDFSVIDYLVKPISFERFLLAVNKAVRVFPNPNNPQANKFIFLKEGSSLQKVTIDDIHCLEAMQNYVRVHLSDRSLMVLMTLKEMLQLLPADFIQTHRSFAINKEKISAIAGDKIHLGELEVPISKRMKSEVMADLRSSGLG